MTSEGDQFRIGGWRRVENRPDGSERRNAFVVDVAVDGATHQVYIRSSNGHAHLPQDLKGHLLGEEIKKAAIRAVLDDLIPQIEAARAKL